MKHLYTETGSVSLTKCGEYLCGDNVEVIEHDDGVTMVLADGLGSGVKANILATLTSKIICTMMAAGLPVESCVETVASTLPVCSERQIAYSTFTIMRIDNRHIMRIIQFDNPSVIMLRDGESIDYPKTMREICGKKIYESQISSTVGDVFIACSDGAEYAGVGMSLNFGWQRDNIVDFIKLRYTPNMSAKMVSTVIADECNRLYGGRAGDDTTIAAMKLREVASVNVMFGPPKDKEEEKKILRLFLAKEGKRVVCGGTTSKIVADFLHVPVETTLDYFDKEVPPCAKIKGIDLTTEGVITMSRVLEYARDFIENKELSANWQFKKDGASLICQMLFEYATDINFFVGRAINPAHQNPDLPITIAVKLQIIDELSRILERMGKRVNINYF